MTYVTVITLVAYGLLILLLGAASLVDACSRRIPNGLVAAMAALWAAWRVALGLAGRHTGVGFMAGLVSPAPEVPLPFGMEIAGESLAGGLIGALVLGGGMLVITAAFEAVARREAFGGGDIKLLAVLGLFLGWERGLLCILAACVISVIYALGVRLIRRVGSLSTAAADDHASSLSVSGSSEAAASTSRKGSTFAETTIPFGPFIALGTLIAFAA